MAASEATTFSIGEVIDGKYRIDRLIGEGGMGAVYEGEHLLIHRRVAIKLLLSQSEENIARFEREAQAAGRIGNDHILEVLDLGRLPSGDRFMVLEYLDGETLAARMEREHPLGEFRTAPLILQVLNGLAAAHSAGVIHRDLKPENIFILREKAGHSDFVKIIDFGISKFAGREALRTSQSGGLIGTPNYMSPEQAQGAKEGADVRSDIYAIGVIMYEASTGFLPHEGETFSDILFKIVLEDPPKPSERRPGFDAAFEEIILRAMARDRAERYQTVDELIADLAAWLASRVSHTSLRRILGMPEGAVPDEPVTPTPSPKGDVAVAASDAEGKVEPHLGGELVEAKEVASAPKSRSGRWVAVALALGAVGLAALRFGPSNGRTVAAPKGEKESAPVMPSAPVASSSEPVASVVASDPASSVNAMRGPHRQKGNRPAASSAPSTTPAASARPSSSSGDPDFGY